MIWRVTSCCLGLWLLACSSNKPALAVEGKAGPGLTPEQAGVTCGPEEAYAYVAQRFRCPDGSNPLGGSLVKAAETRRGSLPAPQGNHILDAYDVPCPGGEVAVYVDMYGCPEYERMLVESEQGSTGSKELQRAFNEGQFEQIIARCEGLASDAPNDEKVWCAALIPACLYGLKRDADGLTALTERCSRLHEATPASDARATYLALVFVSLNSAAEHGKFESNDEHRKATVDAWLQNCGVPKEQLNTVLSSMREE